MAALNYAVQYNASLAQMFPYVLYFGRLYATPNNGRYRMGEDGHSVKIARLTVGGRVDASRDTIGTAARNYDNNWETKDLTNQRKWSTLVHPKDIDQTKMVATIENITTEMNNTQKFPEMDAYTISKIYADWRGQNYAPDIATLTVDNVLSVFDMLMQRADEKRVPLTGRVLYVLPAVQRLLKNATGISRSINAQQNNGVIDRLVQSLDTVEIVSVPNELMKTLYSFANGWVPSASAKQIQMALIHPLSVITPVSYEFASLEAPGPMTEGKYVYYEESHEDVFILNAKADAIQFVMADAGAAGAITVASAAGTETAGDTVITVNGTKESGTTLAYKIAASAIAAPGLGEVPSGYTAFASGATLAGQTASQYIRVVELNADGKVIATGTALLTVKAA
ncbi:MAG: capsid protein [Candidatus Limiplasma sp.]|nr:capsid protein [Candidatus Limiplasma sp.]